jgi:hypothetical protein
MAKLLMLLSFLLSFFMHYVAEEPEFAVICALLCGVFGLLGDVQDKLSEIERGG